ncbi:MAG: lamin tail domain-containing protein [bacterium]
MKVLPPKSVTGVFVKKLIIVLFVHVSATIHAQVILTEVMFDPAGSESSDEFIEIYNSGPLPVELSGFSIGDQTKQEAIISPDSISVLQPGRYAVIFDLDYFKQSGFYDALIPDSALVLAINDKTLGSGGLSNSQAEKIVLLDAVQDTVAEYIYSPGNRPGHSDEKIELSSGDMADNWGDSVFLHGTPGFKNSLSPFRFDLALEPEMVNWIPAKPKRTDLIEVFVTAKNAGLEVTVLETVALFADLNSDSLFTENEMIDLVDFNLNLTQEIEKTVKFIWQPTQSGMTTLKVIATASTDLNQANNSAIFEIPVGYLANDLIINEIMAAPADDHGEWIEVLNISTAGLNLYGWRIADAKSISKPIDEDFHLTPGEAVLLAMDSTITQYQTKFVKINGWPTLNNDEDTILLLDFNRTAIDSVDYLFPATATSGTSLERINPHLFASGQGNWGLSVSPDGATPGEQNSIFTERTPVRSRLAAHPNPFSPDADGREDFTIISYELPLLQSQVNLTIYDLRGRIVRRLLNNAPSGTNRQLVWDGRADDGRILKVGIYIIQLQAINSGQGKLEDATTTVVLAKKL